MPKSYRVWLEIEEYDSETDDSNPVDAPADSYWQLNTGKEEALAFAEKLTQRAKELL